MRLILLLLLLVSNPDYGLCCVPQRELSNRLSESPTIVSGRPLTTFLHYKQFHPNVDENSDDASGKRGRPMLRRSKNWKKTMRYYQTSDEVVFQDEEKGKKHGKRTYEDHWMTQRCYAALDRLALTLRMSPPGQDFGVRLLVLEAWEPIRRRSKTVRPMSLHHEGRALDLAFYVPRVHRRVWKPENRLGLLAFWAIRAGFDWVHYEHREYVHVSCKIDRPGDALQIPVRCFPENATVSMENSDSRRMADLRIGDRILTVDSHGEIVASPVILFLDRSADVIDRYVSLKLANGQELRLSADHLIFRRKTQQFLLDPDRFEMQHISSTDLWSNTEAILAKKLQIGDFVLQRNSENDGLLWAEVVTIRKISDRGAYAPLTAQGTVIVDGVVASCYAATQHETVAHIAMAPIRWLSYLTTFEPSDGLHFYARFLMLIADFVEMFSGFQLYN